MAAQDALQSFKQLIAANPHTGTAQQIVDLSIGIADSFEVLDKTSFADLRNYAKEIGVNEKVFSKLKVIGGTLKSLDEKKRRNLIKHLPASYSTIHLLCALKPEELQTAIATGAIRPRISVRAAEAYVKQVRFPHRVFSTEHLAEPKTKGQQVFGVFCYDLSLLKSNRQEALEKELQRVCTEYGAVLRKIEDNTISALKKQDRIQNELLWRKVLEKQLPLQWFQEVPEILKKQFNIRTNQELINAPLRTFTGFLVKSEGGRPAFWEKHGRAYIAKLQLEQERTNDRVQRHNFKRRLEEVLGERKELAIWRNRTLQHQNSL